MIANRVIDIARSYARAGLSVVPIKTDGSKQPIGSWKAAQTRAATPAEVDDRFVGDCGIAIVHGRASGSTEVIDIDTADLFDPFVEILGHLAPGLFERLCVVQTPRPGYHLIYRCRTVEGNQKLAMRPPVGEESGPVCLIETRGKGGYTLAPGCPPACHPTGGVYEHTSGPALTALPLITLADRSALLMAARTLDRMPIEESPATTPGRSVSSGGLSPGDDYNQRTDWPSLLEPHGWTMLYRQGDRCHWRRPGKIGTGASATTGNLSQSGNDLLCVFSTGAHPFPGPEAGGPCSSHTKFDACARLHHDGDHAAAASELRRLGYGDSLPSCKQSPNGEPEVAMEPPPEWQPFPTHLLPEPLRSIVVEGAKAIGTDESFIALPGLATAAGAIGATRTVRIKRGWTEPAVLWCVVVSPSGATKSQGRKLIVASLLKRQQQAQREYDAQVREFGVLDLAYEQELKQWKAGKNNGPPPEAPEKPQPVELFTSDATIEAMVRVLQANPRGVLLEADELAGWVKGFDAYKGGKGADAQHWINLHGAGHIKVNRAGLAAPIFVPRAAVSVSGTIQPAILTEALGGEHTNSGFAARLLMAEPPRQQKRWTDHEVSEAVEIELADRLGDLLDLEFATDAEGEPYPIALPLAADARERMKRFVNQHGADAMQRDGAEAAAWSKLEGYAARLALVLQLIDAPDALEVSDHWLAAGIELSQWFGNEAARFYRGAPESPEQRAERKLIAWIESKAEPITPAEIARSGPRTYRGQPEAAEAVLNRLVEQRQGQWHTKPAGPAGGRPTRVFDLVKAEPPAVDRKPNRPERLDSVGFSFHATASVPADSRPDPDGWEAA